MKNYLLWFLLFGSCLSARSQGLLSVVDQHKRSALKYIPGDEVLLEVGVDNEEVEGKITALWESGLVVGVDSILFKDIHSFIIKHPMTRNNGTILSTAGIAYAGLVVINRLISNTNPIFSVEAAVASAGMLGIGEYLRRTSTKKYEIGKHYSIRYIHF
jgi:hypothetical protein